MMALLTFFKLESLDLLEDWQSSESLWHYLWSLPLEFWFNFGIESVVNSVNAAIWFADWFGQPHDTMTQLITLGLVYGCYLAANTIGKKVWEVDLDDDEVMDS